MAFLRSGWFEASEDVWVGEFQEIERRSCAGDAARQRLLSHAVSRGRVVDQLREHRRHPLLFSRVPVGRKSTNQQILMAHIPRCRENHWNNGGNNGASTARLRFVAVHAATWGASESACFVCAHAVMWTRTRVTAQTGHQLTTNWTNAYSRGGKRGGHVISPQLASFSREALSMTSVLVSV